MKNVAKASARKSLGEYKPLIVYPDGRTEVCEQSPERHDRNTKRGIVKGNRMARGVAYSSKEEAIQAAQDVIDVRRADAIRRIQEWSGIPGRESAVERVRKEAEMWGATSL
jgi:hypothetical protein